MNKLIEGVVRGNTIELVEGLGPPDGQRVRVMVSAAPSGRTWGDGIRRSAGGWANYPEMDAVMEQIHRERKRERRAEAIG